MFRILIIFLSIICFFGCSSVTLKEEKAFLDSYDSELLYVRIVLPKNNIVPLNLLSYEDVYHYKIIVSRNSTIFSKNKFELFVNSKELEIESGTVKVNDLGGTCELVIDVIPENSNYRSINGSWIIDPCDAVK